MQKNTLASTLSQFQPHRDTEAARSRIATGAAASAFQGECSAAPVCGQA